MSISKEDFLKTIYQITFDEKTKVTSSELARRLGISNAAVTDMARKLSDKGLINYIKYKAITLTSKGKKLAVSVIRKHRLWETFLNKVLNIPNHSVHQEAEMLEHSTSDLLIERIEEYLNYPEFDPHGDPIPSRHGIVPNLQGTLQLRECGKGKYSIVRLQHRSKEVNQFMESNKIAIGNEVTVISKMDTISSMVVKIDRNQIVINNEIASQIHVIKI